MSGNLTSNHLYREALEQVHTYNSKLLLDRRLRIPYIDNQTGLAQQDCHLWVSRVQRSVPAKEGQIYSYPSRRWMVRKRPDFNGTSKAAELKKLAAEDDNQVGSQDTEKNDSKADDSINTETSNASQLSGYEEYYDEEAFDSEFDSDEEFGSRKKKRKSARNNKNNKRNISARLSSRKEEPLKQTPEEKQKFYECQICHKRYKNHQSLRYHYEHHNHNTTESSLTQLNGTEPEQLVQQGGSILPPDHVSGAKRKKGMPPSSYCDFCLGTVECNKKSGTSEQMVSCADCGRSGHPSCLQFNAKLTEQVKKYKWQCIECKCCCLCGTSDNDEQLLFCDACDRGYHMYCLNPPISEPPEGSWQCQLCEARVKGKDVSKVAVLPQHMDIGFISTADGMIKNQQPLIHVSKNLTSATQPSIILQHSTLSVSSSIHPIMGGLSVNQSSFMKPPFGDNFSNASISTVTTEMKSASHSTVGGSSKSNPSESSVLHTSIDPSHTKTSGESISVQPMIGQSSLIQHIAVSQHLSQSAPPGSSISFKDITSNKPYLEQACFSPPFSTHSTPTKADPIQAMSSDTPLSEPPLSEPPSTFLPKVSMAVASVTDAPLTNAHQSEALPAELPSEVSLTDAALVKISLSEYPISEPNSTEPVATTPFKALSTEVSSSQSPLVQHHPSQSHQPNLMHFSASQPQSTQSQPEKSHSTPPQSNSEDILPNQSTAIQSFPGHAHTVQTNVGLSPSTSSPAPSFSRQSFMGTGSPSQSLPRYPSPSRLSQTHPSQISQSLNQASPNQSSNHPSPSHPFSSHLSPRPTSPRQLTYSSQPSPSKFSLSQPPNHPSPSKSFVEPSSPNQPSPGKHASRQSHPGSLQTPSKSPKLSAMDAAVTSHGKTPLPVSSLSSDTSSEILMDKSRANSQATGIPSGHTLGYGSSYPPDSSLPSYLRGSSSGPRPGYGYRFGQMKSHLPAPTRSPVSSQGYGPPNGSPKLQSDGSTHGPHVPYGHPNYQAPGYPPVGSPSHSALMSGPPYLHPRTRPSTPMNVPPYGPQQGHMRSPLYGSTHGPQFMPQHGQPHRQPHKSPNENSSGVPQGSTYGAPYASLHSFGHNGRLPPHIAGNPSSHGFYGFPPGHNYERSNPYMKNSAGSSHKASKKGSSSSPAPPILSPTTPIQNQSPLADQSESPLSSPTMPMSAGGMGF